MSTTIPATGKVTFTVSRMPTTERAKKTLARLMRMNPATQGALAKLSHKRGYHLNERRPRAGRIWVKRARVTKLVKVDLGESFTLTMTPQILPDVKSVEAYLTRKS